MEPALFANYMQGQYYVHQFLHILCSNKTRTVIN